MASNKLTQFAAYVQTGMQATEAARLAGYAEATAHNPQDIVARARAAGLLVDPAVLADAVAIIEEALPDIARQIVEMAKGGRPKHGQQLEAIREAWDRARGKPSQTNVLTGKDGGAIAIEYVNDWRKAGRDG